MLTVTQADEPAFHTRSKMKLDTTLQHPPTSSVTPDMSKDLSPTPKSLTADRLDTLLQMQKKKQTPSANASQRGSSTGKPLKHKTNVFTYSKV